MVSSLLEIKAVGAAGRMGKQDIDLPGIPVVLVLCCLKLTHPESGLFQGLQDPRPVMLKVVEDQGRFPLQGFDQLHEGLNLAAVNLMDAVVLVVHGAICQLQKLIAQCCRAGHANLLLVLRQGQNHLTLHLVIGLTGLTVQLHWDLVIRDIRQLQIILCLHADADIGDSFQDTPLTPRFHFVAVDHAVGPALVRLKIPFTELGVPFPKTFPAVQ